MIRSCRRWTLAAASLALLLGAASACAGETRTVVLIVSDGLRWQEVFTGADPLLLNDVRGRQLAAGEAIARTLLARRRRCAPAGVVPVPLGHGREARTDIRQSIEGQRRARHERAGVLLSRLQRDEHRLPRPPHRFQRVRSEPERDGLRMAERQAAISRPGRGLRNVEHVRRHLQRAAQQVGDANRLEFAEGGARDAARGAVARTVRDDDRVRRRGCAEFLPAGPVDRLRQDGAAAGSVRRLRRNRQLGPPRPLRPRARQRPSIRFFRAAALGRRCRRCRNTAGIPRSSSRRITAAAAVRCSGRSTASTRRAPRTSGSP